MSEMISNDATNVEGLEACFFDDDYVSGETSKGKESTAGRWTHAEHEMFVKGLELHSKQWKLIAELIKTRTVVQVRTHAQKYFQKLLKQAKIDGSVLDDTFADLFNDSSSDLIAGLKRKNNSPFIAKNKVKRTDSNMSLVMETLSRASSDNDIRSRTDGTHATHDKKKKIKTDGSKSPSPRSVSDDVEPYLNSYPIQASDGSSYPQSSMTTDNNPQGDWFNISQTQSITQSQGHQGQQGSVQGQGLGGQGPTQIQGQAQRYPTHTAQQGSQSQGQGQGNSYGMLPVFGYSDPTNYSADSSNYTHGICCNATTANYYQSQSYPSQGPQGSQQMEFPDPFGIGGGDFSAIDRGDFTDLIWYDIDDIPDSASTSEERNVTFIKDIIPSEQVQQTHQTQQTQQTQIQQSQPQLQIQQQQIKQQQIQSQQSVGQDSQIPQPEKILSKANSSNSVYSSETSSAFGSSEAYTSYEESSLTSCTSSDDGCFDDFDSLPCDEVEMGEMVVHPHKRRLSKSSLALNNMNNSSSGNLNIYGSDNDMSDGCDNIYDKHEKYDNKYDSKNSNLDSSWLGMSKEDDDEELLFEIVEAFSS